MAACVLAMLPMHAQISTPFNNGGATDFVGWDNTMVNDPLQIRHNANQPIGFHIANNEKMRLWETLTTPINGYNSVGQNAFVGISDQPLFFSNGPGPFSRLHLADLGQGTPNVGYWGQSLGYRRWMRNGITFTGNSDHGYIGQKYHYPAENGTQQNPDIDLTDMVIQWSNDDDGELGPDRLRFLFTAARGAPVPAFGARSHEGLDAMRLTPVSDTTVNIGMGDFYRGNILDPVNVSEPTERLDILNGRLRVRELPLLLNQNTNLNKYMVVDDSGVVQWRPLPPSATPGCEWYSEPLPAFREVRSGLGNVGTGSCPDRGWLYTVGQNGTLNAKFNLYQNGNERNVQSGLYVNMVTRTGMTLESYGIKVDVAPESGQSAGSAYGLRAEVRDPSSGNSCGTFGKVSKTNSSATGNLHGAYGLVETSGGANGSNVYGTFGRSRLVGSSFTNVFGGYAAAEVDGSSTVGSSIGLDAVSRVQVGTATNSWGVRASSTASPGTISSISYGVQASGSNGGFQSFGVKADAGGSAGTKYGMYASATGTGVANYSVFGASPGNNANDWSGYFPGKTFVGGSTFTPSDEGLKTDIQPVEGPMDLLRLLRPKMYRYRTEEFPQLGLAPGLRYGFLAQEVEEHFPQWTSHVHHPEQRNESGEVVSSGMDFVGLSTTDIIPILVAAVQQQQVALDRLREELAACCSNPDAGRSLQQGQAEPEELFGADPKLRIQPNPFSERTTVFYSVEKSGRAQLLANSADGKELRVLQEAQLEAGQYQYEWDTTELAAGLYYVTLLLDGKPVVKKAVKVAR